MRWDPNKESGGDDDSVAKYLLASRIRIHAALSELAGNTQRAQDVRVAAVRAEMARTMEDARRIAVEIGAGPLSPLVLLFHV